MKSENYQKVGRNEQCSCDSGKKFKKCCLLKQEEQRYTSHFNGNKNELLIENTVGTGLPILVAQNLGFIDKIELPSKGNRDELDLMSLEKIKNNLSNEKITVHPQSNGSIVIKTKNGTIVLRN